MKKIKSKGRIVIPFYLRLLIIEWVDLVFSLTNGDNSFLIEFGKSYIYTITTDLFNELTKFLFGYFIEDYKRKCFLIFKRYSISVTNRKYKELFYFLPKVNSKISLNCTSWTIKGFYDFQNEINLDNVRTFKIIGKLDISMILKKMKNLKTLVSYERKKFNLKEINNLNPNVKEVFNFNIRDKCLYDKIIKKEKLIKFSMIYRNDLRFRNRIISLRKFELINNRRKYIKIKKKLIIELFRTFPNISDLVLNGFNVRNKKMELIFKNFNLKRLTIFTKRVGFKHVYSEKLNQLLLIGIELNGSSLLKDILYSFPKLSCIGKFQKNVKILDIQDTMNSIKDIKFV